ncbi:MAG: hypothetical protein U1C71_01570, partial [archaeon]|nr:hypothetical protein [archaeon]
MRYLSILAILLFLVLAGCVQTPSNGNDNGLPPGNGQPSPIPPGEWWFYAPIQSNTNPWQVADLPYLADPTEINRAREWLSTQTISYDDAFFLARDVAVCAALNCPRGDYLLVHAPDAMNRGPLEAAGFVPMNEPFAHIVSSLRDDTTPTGTNAVSYRIFFYNPTDQSIFYGGCNNFIWERMALEGTTPIIPNTCVWEGLPSSLAPQTRIAFEGTIQMSGEYRGTIPYGIGCDSTQPLSQGGCTSLRTAYSNSITATILTEGYSLLRYDLKQCHTNPWQDPEQPLNAEADRAAFTQWLEDNTLTPENTRYVPPPQGFVACAACTCGSGATYHIILPPSQQAAAETLGFTLIGSIPELHSPPSYELLEWYVFMPFQCYANPWKVPKQPVISPERDMQLMKEWLEEDGITVKEMAFINGFNLDNKCTVRSNKVYGLGIADAESMRLLEDRMFVRAGEEQLVMFTSQSNTAPIPLFYPTKFCATPPWGSPDLTQGNEAGVKERMIEWLATQGILPYDVSIHTVPISTSKACD